MIKKIFALLILSFLVSGGEIYYIKSSPLLGYGNLEDLKADEDKLKYINVSKDYLYKNYEALYEVRPHTNDIVAKDLYKFNVLGFGILEIMNDGVILWQIGIFGGGSNHNETNSQEYIKQYAKHNPRAIASASDFLPDNMNLYSTDWIRSVSKGNQYGEKLATLMPIGWFHIKEMHLGNSIILFEDNLSRRLNVSQEEFLEGYAEFHRVMFERLSFVESIVDEEEPWQGILYFAYYDNYEKIWVVTKSIPEKEIENSKIFIDDTDYTEYSKTTLYPFIFIDTKLEDGSHTLDLVTESKTYTLDFDVDLSPLLFRHGVLHKNGTYTASLINADNKNRSIFVKNATVKIDGVKGTQKINKNLSAYNFTSLRVDLNNEFQEYTTKSGEFKIIYSLDNQEREYTKKIVMRVN